jgi:hypothetical protein
MFSNNIYSKITIPIIHLGLSLSSFIFTIPSYKFNSKIIIWKELQLHNIIFTSRSSLIMLYSLYSNNIYGRLSIVLLHHLFADYVSYNYKTTTRDIPYDNISNFTQYFIKKYYAINQLIATSSLLLSDKGLYENAFMIMYPIQFSTFLSTLVRKNLINNNMWHILYCLSLALQLLVAQITPNCSYKNKLTILFIISRLYLKINKYICISSLGILYNII